MREKIKMVLYIWKKLKEELDDIVSLYEREGRSLKKTEVVSEALSKEVIKRKLEYLSKKLSVLQNIDLDCLASKLYRIRLRLLSLSEDEMAKVTGRLCCQGSCYCKKTYKSNQPSHISSLKFRAFFPIILYQTDFSGHFLSQGINVKLLRPHVAVFSSGNDGVNEGKELPLPLPESPCNLPAVKEGVVKVRNADRLKDKPHGLPDFCYREPDNYSCIRVDELYFHLHSVA